MVAQIWGVLKNSIADKMPHCVVIDETSLQIGDMNFWFWFVIEPETRKIVFFMISRSRTNMACKKLICAMQDRWKGMVSDTEKIEHFDNYFPSRR
ncbi:MAG: DDE-type integrase/transposase/recombinase [Thermoplasmatales archaeon]|nr:DDE-type integrase/transposase/recombinase [Thermoplasmatales archaeon]